MDLKSGKPVNVFLCQGFKFTSMQHNVNINLYFHCSEWIFQILLDN